MSTFSPEQWRALRETHTPADVYAFGVLLFEMATGRRPFRQERNEALMFEILKNAPPPVRSLRAEAPVELDRLVDACLSKEPPHRPAGVALVTSALRRLAEDTRTRPRAAPAVDVIRALAVLPLENVSRDPAQEYFADGMTEALIGDLSRLRALRVISRTSAMKYKGVQRSLPEIARELNVDAILEGSALLVGNRVRIQVQLVEVYATVTDDRGELVTGLRQNDFEVYENDRLQQISAFAAGEFPLTVALGVDRSWSMAGKRRMERAVKASAILSASVSALVSSPSPPGSIALDVIGTFLSVDRIRRQPAQVTGPVVWSYRQAMADKLIIALGKLGV
jgi:TolB-like protein